jgi:hypothetical protein
MKECRIFRAGWTGADLEAAFTQLHRLPILSVKRTYGPHFLGFCLPALLISITLIHEGVIHFPYRYVLITTVGAILVTSMHAMTSDRPYRKGMPVSKALAILEEGKGTQWDPVFAALFVEWVRAEERKKAKEMPLQAVQ